MKNKFWTHVISIVITVITVLFVWFIFGKPIVADNATKMVACLAIIALCNNTRDYISRKENNMDCNKCKSKEYCEYKKNGQVCPYQGLCMDDFFLNWDGTSGNL